MVERITIDNAKQADHLVGFLEAAIEDNHEGTYDSESTSEERVDSGSRLFSAKTFLRKLDPDNEILKLKVKDGVFFDWDAYHGDPDDEDSYMRDDVAGAEASADAEESSPEDAGETATNAVALDTSEPSAATG